jgi:hypothetical protein
MNGLVSTDPERQNSEGGDTVNLTLEQKQALDNGQAVSLLMDGTEYVVLRKDVYEQVKRVLPYDDGPLGELERRFLLQQAGERAGWNDPEMSIYDDLDPRKS